jgi:hypothetical protein
MSLNSADLKINNVCVTENGVAMLQNSLRNYSIITETEISFHHPICNVNPKRVHCVLTLHYYTRWVYVLSNCCVVLAVTAVLSTLRSGNVASALCVWRLEIGELSKSFDSCALRRRTNFRKIMAEGRK